MLARYLKTLLAAFVLAVAGASVSAVVPANATVIKGGGDAEIDTRTAAVPTGEDAPNATDENIAEAMAASTESEEGRGDQNNSSKRTSSEGGNPSKRFRLSSSADGAAAEVSVLSAHVHKAKLGARRARYHAARRGGLCDVAAGEEANREFNALAFRFDTAVETPNLTSNEVGVLVLELNQLTAKYDAALVRQHAAVVAELRHLFVRRQFAQKFTSLASELGTAKTNSNLTEDELYALERKRNQLFLKLEAALVRQYAAHAMGFGDKTVRDKFVGESNALADEFDAAAANPDLTLNKICPLMERDNELRTRFEAAWTRQCAALARNLRDTAARDRLVREFKDLAEECDTATIDGNLTRPELSALTARRCKLVAEYEAARAGRNATGLILLE